MQSTNEDTFSIDPPHVTVDNLRNYLAYDNLFIDYLNAFLSLPIFPVAYHYCNIKGLYQVNAESDVDNLKPNEQQARLSKKWHSMSTRRHSFLPIPLLSMEDNLKEHSIRKARKHISTLILNKRKGLQWIQNERFPLFLQSRLYAEYRLAKILSQAKLIRHDKTSVPDLYLNFVPVQEPPEAVCSPVSEDLSPPSSENAMESLIISYGDIDQSEIESFENNFQSLTFFPNNESDSDLADMSQSTNSEAATAFSSPNISPHLGGQEISCVMLEDMDTITPDHAHPTYLGPGSKPTNVSTNVPTDVPKDEPTDVQTLQISPQSSLHVNNMQELSLMLIAAVMKSAIIEVEGVSENEVEASLSFQNLFPFYHKCSSILSMDVFNKSVLLDSKADITNSNMILTDLFGFQQKHSSESLSLNSVDVEKELDDDFSEEELYGVFSTDVNIREFLLLLKETASEKNWYLWIDLEKFRLSKTVASKEIYVYSIKNKYYNTTPRFELPVELKKEIDIGNWKSLTNTKVVRIQKKILEPFFQYWVPLYLLKKQIQSDPSKYATYFTLKRHPQHSSRVFSTEMDQDVSIFVLKSSDSEEKPLDPETVKPFDLFPLAPTEPKIGMRRTYLISTLQHDSIARHYDWRKVQQKRNSVPEMKVTQDKKTESTFVFRRYGENKSHKNLSEGPDFKNSFNSARLSLDSAAPETIWPKSPIKIEIVDKTSEVVNIVLPKELSCTKILNSNQENSTKMPASSKDKDSEEDSEQKEKYNLLSSLVNALKSERESGDIFAVYLREKDLEKATNCLMLWDAISKFIYLFYDQPMMWPNVIRQVRSIHSEYLSASATQNVGCNPEITFEILQNLNEPTGDMFRYVAEHVLAVLLPPWKEFITKEKSKCIDTSNV